MTARAALRVARAREVAMPRAEHRRVRDCAPTTVARALQLAGLVLLVGLALLALVLVVAGVVRLVRAFAPAPAGAVQATPQRRS